MKTIRPEIFEKLQDKSTAAKYLQPGKCGFHTATGSRRLFIGETTRQYWTREKYEIVWTRIVDRQCPFVRRGAGWPNGITERSILMNVAPLWGEHGCFAASTVFKPQPHINAGAA